MKVYVALIDLVPGVAFPFSHRMQQFLGAALTRSVRGTNELRGRNRDGWSLGINIAPQQRITDNRIVGPKEFRRTKDIEYTLFLPYTRIKKADRSRSMAAEFLMRGVRDIFVRADMPVNRLDEIAPALCRAIASRPEMLEGPWVLTGPIDEVPV